MSRHNEPQKKILRQTSEERKREKLRNKSLQERAEMEQQAKIGKWTCWPQSVFGPDKLNRYHSFLVIPPNPMTLEAFRAVMRKGLAREIRI